MRLKHALSGCQVHALSPETQICVMIEVVSLICHLFSSAPGVPFLSSADAARSPPARSMLRKLSTRKSCQPEVSTVDIHSVWLGRSLKESHECMHTERCCPLRCSCSDVSSAAGLLLYFLKSCKPGALSCFCQQRFLKSHLAELLWLKLQSFRGLYQLSATCVGLLWLSVVTSLTFSLTYSPLTQQRVG